ncbi:Alpha-tocopherol transfer protein-like [Eumeta japonica]|uniref:Alpha-tocopherol transfer protein-like n=1 Tax=Eumeta variegata TaxID=151549 RepID=A0A4C1WVX8_EUMVA|nr:Alpha-tocopherol transfer protein-like [Eumeta japonica]
MPAIGKYKFTVAHAHPQRQRCHLCVRVCLSFSSVVRLWVRWRVTVTVIRSVDACLYKHGPSPGYIFLFDMRGVRFGHILRLNLGSLKKFFDYVQKGLPVRMKSIHVLNTEPLIDKILALIRPFMDRNLYDLIKLHNKNEDLEEFYRDTIPREALPPDHGGTLPDTQTLHTKCMNQLQDLADYFKAEEEQRKAAVAEKHKGKKKEKAFRSLEID